MVLPQGRRLQNGCLALAHANLFFPSTLNGSCLSSGGKVDEKLHHENLSSAIDVYCSRVNKAPCAGTEIHLFRGADSTSQQLKNKLLTAFLKGTKKVKEKLENDHPNEFNEIKQMWDLRSPYSERCSSKVYFLPRLLLQRQLHSSTL